MVENCRNPWLGVFADQVKQALGKLLKHTAPVKSHVQRIAMRWKRGVFDGDAARAGADVYVTSDVKYHEYLPKGASNCSTRTMRANGKPAR